MRRILILFLFLTQAAFAADSGPLDGDNPNTLSNYEGLPSTVVNGCVNVITGDYVESSVDLVLPLPEPFTISRFYTSSDASGDSYTKGSLLCGWNLNHMGSVAVHEFELSPAQNHYSLRTSGGGNIKFKKESKNALKQYEVAKELFDYGLTNTGRGVIGGSTNLRNTKLARISSNEYQLADGSGGYKIYLKHKKKNYLLEKEVLPNGNTIHYRYKDVNHSGRKKEIPVERISMKNFAGQEIAYVNFDLSKISEKHPQIRAYCSDGRNIDYDFSRVRDRPVLVSAARTNGPRESYEYEKVPHGFGSFSRLSKKSVDGGFVRSIVYMESGIKKTAPRDYSYPGCKVKKLIDPCGHIYTFEYLKGKHSLNSFGQTRVIDPLGILTRYKYDSSLRPTSIERGVSFERFRWGNSDHNKGDLRQRLVEDDRRIHFAHRYHYDKRGNVVNKQLLGNLTGKGETRLGTDPEGFVVPRKCNCYEERSSYTNDGRNLLASHNNGRCLKKYVYEPKRSLRIAEFTLEKGVLKERRFCSYDASGAKTLEILDDGASESLDDLTGVTQRLITRCSNYEKIPFFGLPREVAQYAYDLSTATEILLSRKVNSYRPTDGRLISQSIYDADNAFLYELKWEYDKRGNLIRETDAFGYVTLREYDQANRLVKVTNSDSIKRYTYDLLGNPISESQCDIKTGHKETTRHEYNPAKQRTKTIDTYGNETRFQYDIYGNLTETSHPDYFTPSGEKIARRELFHNDILGNPLKVIDALGHKTITQYTARNQPYFICYQNGSVEKKHYTSDGLLQTHYDRNGAITTYDYDYKGRIISKTTADSSEKILSREFSKYDAFNLIEEVDANGYATTYTYDCAGRLVSTKKADGETTLSYNTQGLVETKRIQTTDIDAIVTTYTYDLKGRVLSETTSGITASYTYDAEDRVLTTTTGTSTTATEYDSWGRVLSAQDALGNTTRTHYEEIVNPFGQRVLKTISIDPKGLAVTVVHSPDGSVSLVTKHNLFQELLSSEAYAYDALGNRTLIQTSVIEQGRHIRTIETRFVYDWEGNLISVIEACGEPEQKLTRYTYNERGQKESTLKPDGVELRYVYDALGLLSRFYSSDGTIDYAYTYDAKGNPISCNNTKRSYDAHDHILSETFENGLTLGFTYDRAGQLQTIQYPDMSSSIYEYSGSHLKKIRRLDAARNERYCHEYVTYDSQGNPTACSLPGSAGSLTISYDELSRVASVEAPHWSCRDIRYDSVGNLLSDTIQDPAGPVIESYQYDDLNQLVSEEGSCSNRFNNDSISNITSRNEIKRSASALNQLLQEADNRYEYDLNGNLTTVHENGRMLRLVYDALDRLVEVQTPSETITYAYDAWNRRVSKSTGERYLYIGQNEVGLFNNGIKELRLLGLGKGAEIGSSVSIELDGKVYVPIHDLSGSIVILLNTEGNFVSNQRYSAYGEQLLDDWISPWAFASKRLDKETGFLNFGRRYYSPSMCKWVTPDPIGYDDGPNLYAYVRNSPLVHWDEYGLFLSGCLSMARDVCESFSRGAIDDTTWGLSEYALGEYQCNNVSQYVGYYSGTAASLAVGLVYGGTEAKIAACATRTFCRGVKYVTKSFSTGIKLEQVGKQASYTKIVFNSYASKANAYSPAFSSKKGADLHRHLQYVEEYGAAEVKVLKDERIRYIGELTLASKPGLMKGRRYVHEFNPGKGVSRGWHETLDHSERIRQVRPELNNGLKNHYGFDEQGNYLGKW